MQASNSFSTATYSAASFKPLLNYLSNSSPTQRVASNAVKRLQSNLKIAKPYVRQLAESGSIKYLHYPFAIQTLFFSFINEKIDLLTKNNFLKDSLLDEWIEIKKTISQERENPLSSPRLKRKLETFTGHLIEELKAAHLESTVFSQTLTKFNFLLSLQHIGDLAVSHLCLAAPKEQLKNDFIQVSLPTSAAYQAIEFIIRNIEIEFNWAGPYASKVVRQLMHNADTTLATTPLEQAEILKLRLVEILHFSSNIVEILESATLVLGDIQSRQKIDYLKMKEIENKIEAMFKAKGKREPYQYDIRAQEFVKSYEELDQIFDCLLLEPIYKLKLLLRTLPFISFTVAQLDDSALNEFQNNLLPIFESSSLGPAQSKKLATTPPKRKKKKKKSNNPAQSRKQDTICSFEKEKPTQPVELPNCQEADQSFFRQASQRLLACAANDKTDKRTFLIHAAWHLDKVNTLRKFVNKTSLNPKDFLNILTAITTHSSHAIEQLLDFHILNKNQTVDLRVHNLKILYAILNMPRENSSIQKFYLGTFWARYPVEEFDDWRKSITHDRNAIPSLLENIAFFATENETVDVVEFKAYCNLILDNLEADIAPFMPDARNASVHFVQEYAPAAYFDSESLDSLSGSLTTLMQDLRLPRGKGFFKLRECELSIKMLERTLLHLNEAKNIEEFTFWATRTMLLLQESTDHLLHALESVQHKIISSHHNVSVLEKSFELEVSEFGRAMYGLSKKLKYPFKEKKAGSAADFIDSITSLNLHPQLFDGSEMDKSPYSFWKLPLTNISTSQIAEQLRGFIFAWQEYMKDKLVQFNGFIA